MSYSIEASIKYLSDEGLIATGHGGRPGFADSRVPTSTIDNDGARKYWMPYDMNRVWVEWTEEQFFEHFEHFLVQPCIECGAPIDLDNKGHEDGCSHDETPDCETCDGSGEISKWERHVFNDRLGGSSLMQVEIECTECDGTGKERG